MRSKGFIVASLLLCFLMNSGVFAQSLVISMTLARDQLALVKTSQGITTKISFPERIKEIICGDLYDPADGRGNFVVQRSDNDLFLKPVAATGMSNLFVKTGETGEYTYSFELLVVPVTQSYRIVNVVNGHVNKGAPRKVNAARLPPLVARVDPTAVPFTDSPAMLTLGAVPPPVIEPPPAPQKGELIRGGQRPTSTGNGDTPKLVTAPIELDSEAIRRETPAYPEAARMAGVTGEVVVKVVVNEDGKVTEAKALSGPSLLKHAAVVAARGWRFRPFRLKSVDGAPAEAVGTITFVFRKAGTPQGRANKDSLAATDSILASVKAQWTMA